MCPSHFSIPISNFRDTSPGVITECLVFESIKFIFTFQTFMPAMSRSVIPCYKNKSPILPMILSFLSLNCFGSCATSQILQISSSSLVLTKASQTDGGFHSVSLVIKNSEHFVVSGWVGTLESKYTVFPSLLKGMNTFSWAIPRFRFSSKLSFETCIPTIHIWFELMS